MHLTFVSSNVRGSTQEYDTDSLRDALKDFAERNFAGYTAQSSGPEKWLFAVVVERGESFNPDELVDQFHDLFSMEEARRLTR